MQVELVETGLRQYYDPDAIAESIWAPIAGKQLYLLSFVVVFPVVFLIASWQRLAGHFSALMTAAATHRWWPWLFAQGLAYLLFVGLTYQLSTDPHVFGEAIPLALFGWVVAMLATFALWLLALAPRSYWVPFLSTEHRSLLVAAVAAVCVTAGRVRLQSIAPGLAG